MELGRSYGRDNGPRLLRLLPCEASQHRRDEDGAVHEGQRKALDTG
jgi:hypothetical protein